MSYRNLSRSSWAWLALNIHERKCKLQLKSVMVMLMMLLSTLSLSPRRPKRCSVLRTWSLLIRIRLRCREGRKSLRSWSKLSRNLKESRIFKSWSSFKALRTIIHLIPRSETHLSCLRPNWYFLNRRTESGTLSSRDFSARRQDLIRLDQVAASV